MKTEPQDFFRQFRREDRVLVIIRPDPDSIASAMGIQFLLRRRVQRTDVARIGTMTRLDNKAMVRVLKIRMINYEKVDLGAYTKFVMVDGQPTHFPDDTVLPPFQVVIDHHPPGDALTTIPYVDVRSEYGSNSTIIEEYVYRTGWKIPPRLATALCYGIKSDTKGFERGLHSKDAAAFSRLFPRVRYDLMRLIERWEFQRSSIPYVRKAFNHLHMSRSTLFTFLGKLDNPDILVIVADFLTHVGGISICLAAGVCDGNLSVVFRSDGFQRSAEKLAVQAFGKYGSAGGHITAARAEIPLENLKKDLPSLAEKELERFIMERIRMRRPRPGSKPSASGGSAGK